MAWEHHLHQYISDNNMKLIIIASVIAIAAAGRLENTYLPPVSAGTAGGSGSFLAAPLPTPAFGANFRAGTFGSKIGSPFFAPKPIAPAPIFSAAPRIPAPIAPAYYKPAGPVINIRRYDNQNNGDGTYAYAYETENLISAQETGGLKNVGTNQEASEVHGGYSYVGDDGVTYTVNYIADENGFHPVGAHLPTPPPIPEAIAKSIAFNAAHESAAIRSGVAVPSSSVPLPIPSPIRTQYLPPVASNYNANSGYRY